ncbi:MAG: hypothetical protein JWN85_3347 [Gammaproteobacteria bacterium]|nr:hypothetical protein [Gammaproteobacteria bacterium]
MAGEPAERSTRLKAATVDGLIFTALLVPSCIGALRHANSFPPGLSDFLGIGSGISLVLLIVWLVVTLRLMQRNGQSLAKRLYAIKVVRKDGSPASLARLFWLRNVVNLLPSAIPVVGDIYGIVDALMIYDPSRQCLHDRIADTIVVKA